MISILCKCIRPVVLSTLIASTLVGQPAQQTAGPTPTPTPQQQQQLPPGSCTVKPEYKQFDFWVGEWDVTEKDKRVATSSIQSIVGGCIIFENYSEPEGYTGKSFNFFDSTLGKWRQTWVDKLGNVSEFTGEYRDGAMRYEGETHGFNGKRVFRRMIVYNLGPDRVRQYSERSPDGKTWKLAYDYLYIRRKAN
ncbi:MAG TPA: hypothetical protein VGX92_08580 [Pyrinomonadaceae bacterium]|nr:hypothetical protein [Pyrinomonadaceae bacterium]